MSNRPDIGDLVPDIALETPEGASVKPSAYRGKPLVLFFYPKDDTPGCTTEGLDFSALADQFAAADAVVIGVSRDAVKKLDRFKAKHDLKVVLASDEDGAACEAWGVWVQKKLYGREYMGVERATFLVGRDGNVVRTWRNVRVPGHAAQVLAALKA